jgi:hypothetical protein
MLPDSERPDLRQASANLSYHDHGESCPIETRAEILLVSIYQDTQTQKTLTVAALVQSPTTI